MALTDTRPESGTDASAVAPSVVPSPLTIFGSGDHKAVGMFYVLAALVFGIAGWIAAALAAGHEVGSGSFLTDTTSTQLFQTSNLGLILLVIVPLFLGLATYIVPLQIGASTVAFPRAAAGAMWTWLLSSGVFIVASFIDGGFGGERAKSVSLTLLALGGLIVALLLGTVCVLTTAVTLRTPGMTLDRVPMFTFSMLVGGAIWLLTLPVLLANLLLIWVDHRYGGGTVFGAASSQFGQVAWITHEPQIYAFLVPGLGIVADIVAALTGARLGQRNLLLFAVGAFGVLSVGAWAQPAIYPAFSEDAVWQAMGLLVLLPLLLLLGGVAAAFKNGKPSLKSPLGLAVVSIVLTVLGVLAGALLVITPLELRTTSFFVNGQFILVIGAALTAGVAGIGYWGPKMTGGQLADGIGKLNVLLMLGGGVLGGVSLCVVGFSTRFSGLSGSHDTLVVVSAVGCVLFALGSLLAILGLLSGARKGAPEAGADAWGTGQTLEWACASPPPTGNFGDLAVVRSPEPLLDEEA